MSQPSQMSITPGHICVERCCSRGCQAKVPFRMHKRSGEVVMHTLFLPVLLDLQTHSHAKLLPVKSSESLIAIDQMGTHPNTLHPRSTIPNASSPSTAPKAGSLYLTYEQNINHSDELLLSYAKLIARASCTSTRGISSITTYAQPMDESCSSLRALAQAAHHHHDSQAANKLPLPECSMAPECLRGKKCKPFRFNMSPKFSSITRIDPSITPTQTSLPPFNPSTPQINKVNNSYSNSERPNVSLECVRCPPG